MPAARQDEETTFEELGQQGPQQRFQMLMAKESRRYELLVFAVEVCYLLIYLAYFITESRCETSQTSPDGPPDGRGFVNALRRLMKNDTFYSSCVDGLCAKNQSSMAGIEAEIRLRRFVGEAVNLTDRCQSEATSIGEFLPPDELFSPDGINKLMPAFFVIFRAHRLFGFKGLLCARCKIKSAWLSWALDTFFHILVLSWYGAMAGLFSMINLPGSGKAGKQFIRSLYVGPPVYVFILTVSCLTVLDVRQTVIASTISFSCFATPFLTSQFRHIDFSKKDLDGQKLRALDGLTLLFAIIAVCYVRYCSWRDRAGDFERTDKLMTGIINEKVKRCAAEFNAEQLQVSRTSGLCDGQDTDYLSLPVQHAEADLFATTPAAMWPSPSSCLSAPADIDRLAFLEKGGEPRCECLPLSAKVYLKGAAMSTDASELLEGDQVLCYDHLASSIKFVEVEDVGTVTGECEWCHMVMADGTRVSMTADHPVRVVGQASEVARSKTRGAWGLGGGRVSPAGNLIPGEDMLKLLRLGAVPLAELHRETDIAPRVRVNLKQSWRYSLFCSQSAGLEMTAVAVESSNALEGRCGQDVHIKHGFLCSAEGNSTKKPKSAPERLLTADVTEFGKSDATASNARDLSRSTDVTWAVGSSEAKEARTDMADGSEEAQDDLHAKGQCQPCLFQYRHQKDPDKYPMCMKDDCQERNCHQIHSEEFVQNFKKAKRIYERKNRLSYRKVNGQVQGAP
eukprot:TRINITY_DN3717_c0_g1_i1.p1 TRINITY_DN3717_c0_g1~~TRINITY_DN3717_c0_g1_i1.p1  ORF type:complete len:736 (+),score=138.00 TRINITY_DN3717_c0_g1_i1:92-2299(+)